MAMDQMQTLKEEEERGIVEEGLHKVEIILPNKRTLTKALKIIEAYALVMSLSPHPLLEPRTKRKASTTILVTSPQTSYFIAPRAMFGFLPVLLIGTFTLPASVTAGMS
jgi:hypothetical protein